MTRLSDPTKRVKKTSFNVIKFLCQHHDANNIYDINIQGRNSWHSVLLKSDITDKEGLMLFLDANNTIIYIGHTIFVYQYITRLFHAKGLEETRRVILVTNENPSMLVHAANAYRAKFTPKYNSEKGNRFIFNDDGPVINLTVTNQRVIEWIKNNPNSSRKDFINCFKTNSFEFIRSLCRVYSLKRLSYKELKTAILKGI